MRPLPAELRQIAFSATEVIIAVREHRRRTRNPLPTGTIAGFEMRSDNGIYADMAIADDATGNKTTIRFNDEALAAALILYCIDHKIPMPVKATKSLGLFEGELRLIIRIASRGAQS
jgi:hypothetical protein